MRQSPALADPVLIWEPVAPGKIKEMDSPLARRVREEAANAAARTGLDPRGEADVRFRAVGKAFDESKHARDRGRFAPKGSGTVPGTKREGSDRPKPGTPEERAKAVVEVARNVLRVLGYAGEDMVTATKRFQTEHKLKPTGEIDRQTLIALRDAVANTRSNRAAGTPTSRPDQPKKRVKGELKPKQT